MAQLYLVSVVATLLSLLASTILIELVVSREIANLTVITSVGYRVVLLVAGTLWLLDLLVDACPGYTIVNLSSCA